VFLLAEGPSKHGMAGFVALILVWALGLIMAVIFLAAGVSLLKLRAYPLAMVGVVLEISLGLLTLPVGVGLVILSLAIWSVATLRRHDVRAAFRANTAPSLTNEVPSR